MASLFDYQNVTREVHEYCSMADFNIFDEKGIVLALRDMAYDIPFPIRSIDDVDSETWEALLDEYDTGIVTTIA